MTTIPTGSNLSVVGYPEQHSVIATQPDWREQRVAEITAQIEEARRKIDAVPGFSLDEDARRVALAQQVRESAFGKKVCLVCGGHLGPELRHL